MARAGVIDWIGTAKGHLFAVFAFIVPPKGMIATEPMARLAFVWNLNGNGKIEGSAIVALINMDDFISSLM